MIIPGGTLIGSVLTHHAKHAQDLIGAPVLDGMVTGFKMAETMVDLQQRAGIAPVSRRGFFRFPPAQDVAVLRNALGRKTRKG